MYPIRVGRGCTNLAVLLTCTGLQDNQLGRDSYGISPANLRNDLRQAVS